MIVIMNLLFSFYFLLLFLLHLLLHFKLWYTSVRLDIIPGNSCNCTSALRIRYNDRPLDPGAELHINTKKLPDVCRQNWIQISLNIDILY